jgi:hypothetical protein
MAVANNLQKLFQFRLTNADALIYTCPALTVTTIVALYKVCTDAVDRTFRLFALDAGGASGVLTAIYYDEPIATLRTHPRIDSGILLEPGQTLRGLSSVTNTITLTGFGIESVTSS